MRRESTLNNAAIQLFRNRPRGLTMEQINEDLGISPSWLTQWASGSITGPSVVRVQVLYEYLSGRKLTL